MSATGEIVTPDGYTVEPGITIPNGATSVTVNAQGQVSARLAGQTTDTVVGQLDGDDGAGLTARLWDLAADPRETRDRSQERPERARALKARARRPWSSVGSHARAGATVTTQAISGCDSRMRR